MPFPLVDLGSIWGFIHIPTQSLAHGSSVPAFVTGISRVFPTVISSMKESVFRARHRRRADSRSAGIHLSEAVQEKDQFIRAALRIFRKSGRPPHRVSETTSA